MIDENDPPKPQSRLDFGCGMLAFNYLIFFPLMGWVIYPLGKATSGSVWPYLLITILAVVMLWPFPWWRKKR